MTLNLGKYKFKIMKIILSVIFLFLINSISYSWEKIPIPKNLDKKKVSPFTQSPAIHSFDFEILLIKKLIKIINKYFFINHTVKYFINSFNF